MGVVYPQETRFPLIDKDPGVAKSLQNFRTTDWQFVGAATAVNTVIGYYIGRTTYMHRSTAVAGGFIGVAFGLGIGLQNSMGRQMGLIENQLEVDASKAEQ
jgi:NADH-ubiquinone oxidoreductase complex I, 21 kDa subunit